MECKHYLIRLFIDFCGKRVGEIEMGWEQKALSWVNLIMMMIIIVIIIIIIIIIVMRFKSGHFTR